MADQTQQTQQTSSTQQTQQTQGTQQASQQQTSSQQTQQAQTQQDQTQTTSTILGGDKGTQQQDQTQQQTQTQQTAPADWPTDWRQKLATRDGKTDDKLLKQLERYGSPTEVATAMGALQQKLSETRRPVNPFPDKGTPEQQAQWRSENGIPAKAEEYLAKLGDGIVVGDDDKKFVGVFLDAMHGKNASPEMVQAALGSYYKVQELVQQEQIQNDVNLKRTNDDALHQEWGAEYRPNLNAIMGLLNGAPEGVKDVFMGARLPDGTPVASHLPTLRWLRQVAVEFNPAATIAPSAGGRGADGIASRLAEISKMKTDSPKKYWSEPVQKEERTLLEAQEKMKGRAA